MVDKIRLGIDFGTTTTAVSLKIGDDLPIALPIGKDGSTTYFPSIVYFPPNSRDLRKRIKVGEEAEDAPPQGLVVQSVKRCLSCQGNRCAEQNLNRSPWCHGDGKVHIPGVADLLPENVAYFIILEALNRAIERAKERLNLDLRAMGLTGLPINLGCPAAFNLEQRHLLIQAAHDAGLKHLEIDNIVEEPILSGFTFSRFANKPDGRVLIYDFGGGSFDTAVLQIDRGEQGLRIAVLATDGDNWLGGDDIDRKVERHFIRIIADKFSISEQEVEAKLTLDDWRKLRRLSKRAKEDLSKSDEFSDVLLSDEFGTISIDLTVATLNDLIGQEHLIERSLEAVLRACKLAYALDLAPSSDLFDSGKVHHHTLSDAAQRIQRVVLVGGVSKTPLVKEQIARIFGGQKIESESIVNPIDAVAIGAAYQREEQHYSLAYPPYEFVLKLQERSRSPVVEHSIFKPFEFYDFYRDTAWSSIPAHRSNRLNLDRSYSIAKLGYRRIGKKSWAWLDVSPMHEGLWEFIVGLDGQIAKRFETEAPLKLECYPLVHPLQSKIREERENRREIEREIALARAAARDKTIYTEN